MYLGSVRFFKQLIITVVFLLIIGLTVTTVLLYFDGRSKQNEIEQLNSDKNSLQALYNFSGDEHTATKINEILDILKDLGINNKDLVNTIYDNDKSAFDDVTEAIEASAIPRIPETAVPPPATTLPPSTTPAPEPEEPVSPYANLHPNMYADYIPPENYIDDTGYIYLTFDDGPSQNTVDILRYLDKHKVKATFFVMPDDTERGEQFLNTMLDSGHQIGVHTMTHVYNDIYASVEAYLEDFNEAFELIYKQTGYKPYLFRFPGGSINDFNVNVRKGIIEEMTRRGFVYFDWNVDSRDAMDANWTQMYNSVLSDVANLNRAVILFHDRPGGYNTVTVIEDIIKALLTDSNGYKLSPILHGTRPMQF